MQRKVIQIAISGGGPDSVDVLYALCDDGSIWAKPAPCGNGAKWEAVQADDIPQRPPIQNPHKSIRLGVEMPTP